MTRVLAAALFSLLLLSACTKTSSSSIDSSINVEINDQAVLKSSGLVSVDLELSKSSSSQTSLMVRLSDETAKSGVDFNPPSVNKIVFAPGVVKKNLQIPLVNDGVKRPDRQFRITLEEPNGINLLKSTATIKIVNDNTTPEIYFSQPALVIPKTAGTVNIDVSLSIALPEPVSVSYTVSGTATPLVDHKFQSGVITFYPGQTVSTISGEVINTQTAGLNKTVVITLSDVSGFLIGSPNFFNLVIADGNLPISAVLDNVPTGTNNLQSLNVTVSGSNVANYKYKISASSNCDEQTGYSNSISIAQPISDSLTGLPDGRIFLCVEGGNSQGVFQSPQTATVVSWIKNTNPPSPPIFLSVTSPYRELSTGVYLSNQSEIKVQLSGLTAGFTAAIYDSSSCASTNEIGRGVATSNQEVLTGTYLGDGDHSLSARLFDQFGQGSSCLSILSKYTLDTVIPIVTDVSTTAASGNYGINSDIQIKVKFSKTIVVGGPLNLQPYLTLNTSPSIASARFISSSGDTALFDYQPSANENSAKLDYFSANALIPSGNTIRDLAGNSVYLQLPTPGSVGSLSGKVNILVDTTPPNAVVGFQDGNYGPRTVTPVFTWQESVDPNGSGIAKYQVSIGTTPGGVDVLNWTDTVTNSFSAPASNLLTQLQPGITYYGAVRAVDRAGNKSSVTQGNGWQVDDVPPTVPVVTIAQTSTFSKTQSPLVSWTKSTDLDSGVDHYEIALGSALGTTDVVGWITLNNQTTSYIFSFNGQYGKEYYSSVRAVDRAGNISTGFGGSWATVQPNTTPSPLIQFTDKSNVNPGAQVVSETKTVQGLDVDVQATVSSDKGLAFIIVNNNAPVSSATIKNGYTVAIQTTASSSYSDVVKVTLTIGSGVYTWTVTSWGCPNNYLLIQSAPPEKNFCIAKYKATIISGVALSRANGDPSGVNQFAAQVACQQNGVLYDLISNTQYQSVARNIEQIGSNWSSGTAGVGELSGGIINSAVYPASSYEASANDNDACFGAISSVTCSNSTWNKYRRTFSLSSGERIWDLAGGRYAQWVSNKVSSTVLNGNPLCSGLGARTDSNIGSALTGFDPSAMCLVKLTDANGALSTSYGPSGNYFSLYPDVNSEWGGIGYTSHYNPSFTGDEWLLRGGTINDESGTQYWHGGVFTTVGVQAVQNIGIGAARCVYNQP